MDITYPGPREAVEKLAEKLPGSIAAPGLADIVLRLGPLRRFSDLLGQAVEIARAEPVADGTDPTAPESLSEPTRDRLRTVMTAAQAESLALLVSAEAAGGLFDAYAARFGLDRARPESTNLPPPLESRVMAGEKKPDALGRAIQPQETYGQTPGEPVKTSDPAITGAAEQAGIKVEEGPGPIMEQSGGAPAPEDQPPAARKDDEAVQRGLMTPERPVGDKPPDFAARTTDDAEADAVRAAQAARATDAAEESKPNLFGRGGKKK